MKTLIRDLRKGDKRAAARLISICENGGEEARAVLKELGPFARRAQVVGITGAPGSGKSTLINCLIGLLRARQKKVGVIAIDPSSPLSGGALLGDRIRMHEHSGDRGVFIRSMATRKGTGGVSRAAGDAARVLDALGLDVVFIETTGVGQSEIAVRDIVHTVVVVVTPGLGDEVQMMKAGLMEIADVFVVNKGDISNAEGTARALKKVTGMLPSGRKAPPVVVTAASEGRGVDRLLEELERQGGRR